MAKPREEYIPRKYLDHFTRDGNGKYQFTGVRYCWEDSEEKRKKFLRTIFVYAMAVLALASVPGFSASEAMLEGSGTVFGFLLEMTAAVAVLWKSVNALFTGQEIRDYQFKRSLEALPRCCILSVIAAALSFLALVIYCLRNGGNLLNYWPLLSSKIVEALLAIQLRKTVTSAKQNYIKKDNGQTT